VIGSCFQSSHSSIPLCTQSTLQILPRLQLSPRIRLIFCARSIVSEQNSWFLEAREGAKYLQLIVSSLHLLIEPCLLHICTSFHIFSNYYVSLATSAFTTKPYCSLHKCARALKGTTWELNENLLERWIATAASVKLQRHTRTLTIKNLSTALESVTHNNRDHIQMLDTWHSWP
jgi:hypothetical protein